MMFLTIYLTGAVIGLMVMRDGWASRLITALLWPLGPLAFVVVLTILLVVAAVLWPLPVLGATAVLAGIAWVLF